MWTDLYTGRGKNDPSITSRLAMVEDAVARFGKNSSTIVMLLAGLVVTVIGDVVVHFIK